MSQVFLPSHREEIKLYYKENGYVVVKNAISLAKIDAFMQSYDSLKQSKNYYFRSQDTNRVEKLSVNAQGFIEHSMINPIEIAFQRKFCRSAIDVICSESIAQLLKTLTGKKQHTTWQTMFFDRSTGTVPHQDHFYLDSDPPGHLVACWYALEDIQPGAGPFFVVPKSHKGPLIARRANREAEHAEFVQETQALIREKNYQPQPMLLEKGSVLFWHPFLIHGALTNSNPQHSRKSFTAHFLPEGYGQLGIAKARPTTRSVNPDILLWKKSLFEQMSLHLRQSLYGAKAFFTRHQAPPMEMRASKY